MQYFFEQDINFYTSKIMYFLTQLNLSLPTFLILRKTFFVIILINVVLFEFHNYCIFFYEVLSR